MITRKYKQILPSFQLPNKLQISKIAILCSEVTLDIYVCIILHAHMNWIDI